MNFNSPITQDPELDSFLFQVKHSIEDILYFINTQKKNSYSGTFIDNTGKTVTVKQGIVVSVI
jgi:hypothetical protein